MKRFFSFMLLALLWLPLGIFLVAPKGILLFVDSQVWLALIFLAPLGLPLALACRALRRGGHVVSAWVTFIVLAPATVGSVVIGGLFGPLGIALYVIIFSLPAWAVYGFFHHRTKSQPA